MNSSNLDRNALTKLNNPASEKGVLAGLIKHGKDAYLDVSSLIEEDTFTIDENKVIYKCLIKLFETSDNVDLSSIISASQQLSLYEYLEKGDRLKQLNHLMHYEIHIDNIRKHAQKLRKLQLTRSIQNELKSIYLKLNDIDGDESINEITSIPETDLQKITLKYLREDNSSTKLIGENIDNYLQLIMSNQEKEPGISTGYPIFDTAIGGGLRRGAVDLIGARAKALKYGSKVFTPQGFKVIEDIEVGDVICHPVYGRTTVTATHDYNTDIFRVTFRDGDYVDCCGDHLWEVYKRYPYAPLKDKTPEIKSTKELINNLIIGNKQEYKWDVKLTQPVDFEKQPVAIDPYILGLILGDGTIHHTIKIHMGVQDQPELLSYVEKTYGNKVKLDYQRDDLYTYRINGLISKIKDMGLYKTNCHTKFIPKEYIYNCKETRIEILRGLMDTDGTVYEDKNSTRCSYSTVSLELAKGVKEIVQSLGGLCSINKSESSNQFSDKKYPYYRCEIRLENINPFKLKRKSEKVTPRQIGDLKRSISKIESLNIADNARCITISDNDGLFITDNYVITHNCGKSTLADNVALDITKRGIPVLVLDTEMGQEDHWNRLLANISGIPINDIASSKFNKDPEQVKKIEEASEILKEIPYHYISVAGRPFDEILGITRRWLFKEVKYNNEGRMNECLVIYDYMKLMTSDSISGNIAEYQALGFQITQLVNFCVEYDIPCLSFVQLNRDGITKETEDAISGSDRLIWLCTSFSIFKARTEEEINEENVGRYANRRLVPIVSRHGPGSPGKGGIYMNMRGELAKLEEIGTKRDAEKQARINNEGFEREGDSEDSDDSEYGEDT